MIEVETIRLVDHNGEMVGVVPRQQGLDLADEVGLDLVEVSPNADPPVCKLLDYGKFKYEAQKKANEARKRQKTIDVKEIKMRPTIDDHDYLVKMRSIERFIGILIEHTGGNFPFWLAPVQTRVLTISDSHREWAQEVVSRIKDAGFTVEEDFSNTKTGAKIREARLQRVPYVLVVGDREVEAKTVAVRERPDKDLGPMALDSLLDLFAERIRSNT